MANHKQSPLTKTTPKPENPAAGPPPPTPPGSPETARISGPRTTAGGRSTPHLHVHTGSTVAMDVTNRALSELANSQIQLLGVLASGFNALAKQTLDVITIGPATEVKREVEKLRVEIKARHDGRKIDKDGAEAAAKAKVAEVVKNFVQPRVQQLVAEAVAREIGGRVRHKLKELVSQGVKDELTAFRHRVTTVRIELENKEARWRNSLIPSDQPLHRLLRPPVPLGVLLGTPNVDGAGANGDGKGKPQKKANGNADANAAVAGAGEPSQVFPRTTDDIPTLDAATARRLVEEYQIVPPAEAEADGWEDVAEDAGDDGAGGGGEGDGNKGDSGRSTPNTTRRNTTQSTGAKPGTTRTQAAASDAKKAKAAKEKEKEEREKREAALKERRRVADLNAFMHFVGLGHLELLPAESAPSGNGTPTSPLFERSQGRHPNGMW